VRPSLGSVQARTEHFLSEEDMAEATVTWLQDHIFVGTDSTKHSIVLSSHGEGGGVGMKPSELVLISLAACTAVDIVNIFDKMRTPLDLLEIHVSGEQDPEPPWKYSKIQLSYRIRGNGITKQAAKRAIELSEEKYCSVSASLRGQVDIGYDFEILSEENQ
jgi:putative redox protein